MPDSGHFEKVIAHAKDSLIPLRKEVKDRSELLKLYRSFIKKENFRIRLMHRSGAGGVSIASRRSTLLDVVINDLLSGVLEGSVFAEPTSPAPKHPVTLVASGGYGRGVLNPGSDIDLLFLLPEHTRAIGAGIKDTIEQVLLMLYDVGFKVGHAVRSIPEAIKFANQDHQTKTALLDARFIAGDATLFDSFTTQFIKSCIKGREHSYLAQRSEDIRARHKKWGQTIHLQEPNVKEGCGGLRDYHNLIWVLWVLRQSRDLSGLVRANELTLSSFKEIENAYEFLMRVRNGLHYAQKNRSGDLLTLRHQGILAEEFKYPQKSILRKSEAFMRDYYFHARNLFQHSTSIMQAFELEVGEITTRVPVVAFLARLRSKDEFFDGFFSRDGLIFPENEGIFKEDPNRMMRMFRHTQSRHLTLGPEIRRLFRRSYFLINRAFRASRSNRETFEQILQERGDVARILRQMHRVGFLGRYLPEFGALTDLVQHEFFHRYSADEHTLRCIEHLDALAKPDADDKQTVFFRQLLQDLDDPYVMYMALILHDTGRAENMRHHEDASALLASQVCTRLRIRGTRRRFLTFLVDHHLTFWRTATTQNLDDPETIERFAASMQNRSFMEALFLFTYVDSRGTNEDGWNDWKSSLMMKLYRSTCSFFEDRKKFTRNLRRPEAELKEVVQKFLPGYRPSEIDAHFDNMPERYFRFRGPKSITRHLKLFHRFYEVVTTDLRESAVPLLGWDARPDEGYSLCEVVGWNRHHLLAKVAGALAARNINILSADLFTRSDDLVLDIFRVCTTNFSPVTSEREQKKVENLLRTEFSVGDEEIDFRALIGSEQRPSPFRQAVNIEIPQRVFASNSLNSDFTVLELQAQDRLGLLYDVFTIIGDHDMEVVHARISTQAGAAIDRFYLIDSLTESKIFNEKRLRSLENKVADVIGA